MRAALTLAILAMAMTAGCLGGGTPEPPTPTFQEWVSLYTDSSTCENRALNLNYQNERQAMQGPQIDYISSYYQLYCVAPTPPPTSTFYEWLQEEASTLNCDGYPQHELRFENERRHPPYSAEFYCAPPPTPTRPPTPTMQQIAEWSPETSQAWDQCWRARGEFEIGNIRQGSDSSWRWQYRCNPPPAAEQRRLTAGASEEDLLKCGLGVTGAYFTGEWTLAMSCLGLLTE